MTFIMRMALREIRASWQRLLFFFVCIAIGVGSIVALRSVIQSVRVAFAGEARTLLGADVTLTTNRPWTGTVLEALDAEQLAGRVTLRSETAEIPTMVRPEEPSRLATRIVELRAVGPEFPLYGSLTLDGRAYTHALLAGHGALVRPELLTQFGLEVGDRILIGMEAFEIRGVITAEPGRRIGAFTLGPRVMIDRADLDSTGLLTFGSRASFQQLLRVPEGVAEALVVDLRETFANEFVRVRWYRRMEDQMGENLTRAEDYLSLVGLVVLILGGIGVSSVTRVFVQQKVRSIAILKCLGTTSPQMFAIYLTQVLLLGVAGSALGVALAAGVMAAVPAFVGDLTELMNVDFGLTAAAVLQGFAIGLLVSMLFSLVPLLEVRHVKPSLLLRQDVPPSAGVDWLKWAVTAGVAAALVAVAAWQAGSLEVGLMLSGGFVATAFVLHLAGAALVRAVQPLRYSKSFALRQAVLHIARPGNQTRVILLAVGLGAFFILGVRTLQENLLRDFAIQAGPEAPDMFLIDIQQDQRDRLAAFLDESNGPAPAARIIPTLRARVVAVQGREMDLDSYEAVRGRGLEREYTVTYRPHLEANEELIEGTWWGDEPMQGEAEVSIEERFSDRDTDGNFRMGSRIQVGDQMRFDVLGRIITARVTSVRRVDWQDFRAGGFMFVFRPGTFDRAPHAYISALQGPSDPGARARMQAALVTQFPNVSVIDLREILQTVQAIVNNVTRAVTVVGALVLVSGGLILVGAVSMTKFRRVYEAAIFKTLGASGRLIAAILVLEYGVLGAIAGTVGALGAIVLSWAVARYALELPWEATPGITMIGIVATSLLVAVIGVLASLDVLRHKPLATLRAE
ncbi:MAG: outer rane-specific lipoprotein transporter subunit LolC [Acidobacteria bacterium]|nr:outer rane-specific lipoprotein transporter subunit LolC [Acidobacteriota bacterium]